MLIALALAASVIAGLLLFAFVHKSRRKALLRIPLSKDRNEILERNVPLYRRLPEDLKHQLHGHIHVFMSEKRFEGCDGLEMTDEIKVTIAAQACLLLLNRETKYYPRLSSILVYPGAYVGKRIEGKGPFRLVSEEVRMGESHGHDYVVLSWDHIAHKALDLGDGRNIVLHEFAHQLDQEDGVADGVPVLKTGSQYKVWARVLGNEYKKLGRDLLRGEETVLDQYGATNAAEFFAVVTETFFEKPRELKEKSPKLYDEVKKFYKVDPLDWVF